MFNIDDRDSDICALFERCFPDSLKYLCINYPSLSKEGIKMRYYLNFFLKAIRGVKKEIFIRCFSLSEFDLEQVVKASYSSERLVFRFCDIRCSRNLNFCSLIKPNLKLISFDSSGWGSSRSSDFIANPSCFENIVEAISKSKLKDTLENIDICSCSLSQMKVKKMFIKHGAENVGVIIAGDEPNDD